MFNNFFNLLLKNKKISVIVLVLIVGGGFLIYKNFLSKGDLPQYVIGKVSRGKLEVFVSGSGQVSNLNELEIKSKVNGEVLEIYPSSGESVKAGSLLAIIDYKDAQRALRDAEINLEIAKLELEKMIQPPNKLTLVQAENALSQAREKEESLKKDLQKAYEDGFNSVTNAFLELSDIITGLENVILGSDFNRNINNLNWYADQISDQNNRIKALEYQREVLASYNQARKAYSQAFDFYKSISRDSSQEAISELISQAYDATRLISEAIKKASNYIDFVRNYMESKNIDIPSKVLEHRSIIGSYTSKINLYLSSLLVSRKTIKDFNQSILEIQRTIREREISLEEIKKGPDEIDIQAKKISIQQKENALLKAKEFLADHYIKAPFDGVVAKVNIKKRDTVFNGNSLFVLATRSKMAEISLNEIDAARVKVGQKAFLSFDALPDLSIEGKVVEVSFVGDISQGVVTYNVKIEFNSQDERIKPSMSVSAKIIVEEKNDVLLIPNSALRFQQGEVYVEVVDEIKGDRLKINTPVTLKNTPKHRFVKIGLSNDDFSEVLDGLSEDELIILRVIQSQSGNKSSKRSSAFPGISTGLRSGSKNPVR